MTPRELAAEALAEAVHEYRYAIDDLNEVGMTHEAWEAMIVRRGAMFAAVRAYDATPGVMEPEPPVNPYPDEVLPGMEAVS